ncbi:MAG: serine protease [Daejeonella sp.]
MIDHSTLAQVVFKVSTSNGSGTCFYLKQENIFVSNFHVVDGSHEVAIEDVKKNRFLAKVVMVNPQMDVAFLRTEEFFENVPTLSLDQNTDMNSGEKIYVAGFPFGMPFTVTDGIVSAVNQLMDGKYYLQTDAAVNPGNSGGPMFNEAGEVVAITTSKFTEADNMGFGIPVKLLIEELKSLKEIDGKDFTVKCSSCSSLIYEQTEHCQNCGNAIDSKLFDKATLTELAVFCEKAISEIGINPVLARTGYEYWQFYKGSSLIRIFIYDNSYLYITSPINGLPKQNLEGLFRYLLSAPIEPFKLGIYNSDVFVSYRVAIVDIFSEEGENIAQYINQLAAKADELDHYLVENFDCPLSEYAKKSA